ncbi:lipase member K-like isoform X2 [Nasonia vitripennis]|uniref:Lipase n=1 Tax=Nasonia vitripennis TaxID=7425 RepID=A0A7M7QCM5_NASVI|nr:lipase member K-like isoform X2 [Nasonia vitripennis]
MHVIAAIAVRYSSRGEARSCRQTTLELIRETGYAAEEHFVSTEDGYILALHRIPGSAGAGSPAVLLQHALLESSFCWVVSGRARGLGQSTAYLVHATYILADEGYDVWMGNARGNSYSRNHTSLSPSEPGFWNFSWHEMGKYDLPAEIEYITRLKKASSLLYVGHSMGTTAFYAMASERPAVASKVKAMFGLAPVAFTDHAKGPFWLIGSALRRAQRNRHSSAGNLEGTSEFFAQSGYFKFAAKCICNRPLLRDLCRAIVFSTVGFDPQQLNSSWLPLILSHTPAGTSFKTILHFAQGIESRRFLHYDYGAERNAAIYGSAEPPEYDLSKIDVPVALFWAENDFLAQPRDVLRLYDRLPRKIDMQRIDNPNFNHLDFLWGRDAPELVYSRLLRLMERYRA